MSQELMPNPERAKSAEFSRAMNESLKQAAEKALSDAGVPVNLAAQCAEIVAKDDPTKENLGRTQEEQHLINSSMQWMEAKGVFEN
jgi:hypothetical protein